MAPREASGGGFGLVLPPTLVAAAAATGAAVELVPIWHVLHRGAAATDALRA